MCGIFGVLDVRGRGLPPSIDPAKALEAIRHRGPDGEGLFRDPHAILGVRRLAIIDPVGGDMPMTDEASRFHIVMNGEVYDFEPLRDGLEQRGHRFRSRSDVEVALHLLEEGWIDALDKFDGQFAIALYDARERRFLLARDRMGICPLFYAEFDGTIAFASEMKALFAAGVVAPRISRRGMDSILAFGSIQPPWTSFEGVRQLPAGCFMEIQSGTARVGRYWDIPYPQAGDYPRRGENEWVEGLRARLEHACKTRRRADAPVGVFLSGGLDSGSIASLTGGAEAFGDRVFSLKIPDPGLDESPAVLISAKKIGVKPNILTYDQTALARDFPTVLYHAETPVIYSTIAPFYALARMARGSIKVVLNGEGSDEALAGYPHFVWEKHRERLLRLPLGKTALNLARSILLQGLGLQTRYLYPVQTDRWAQEVFGFIPSNLGAYSIWRSIRVMVYSDDMLERASAASDAELVDLPREAMRSWDPLNRSLYVASRMHMQAYLLGPHSDRVLMANSIEGRHPFLDREVQEFLAVAPPDLKIHGRWVKYLLRRAMDGRLAPRCVWGRKRGFWSAVGTPFLKKDAPDYARELLSPALLREFGYFDPAKIARLTAELDAISRTPPEKRHTPRAVRRNIRRLFLGAALTFVISTQILESVVRDGYRRPSF